MIFTNDPDKIIGNSINRDSILLKPLNLTVQEKDDLKAFMLALTDKQFNHPLHKDKTAAQIKK